MSNSTMQKEQSQHCKKIHYRKIPCERDLLCSIGCHSAHRLKRQETTTVNQTNDKKEKRLSEKDPKT